MRYSACSVSPSKPSREAGTRRSSARPARAAERVREHGPRRLRLRLPQHAHRLELHGETAQSMGQGVVQLVSETVALAAHRELLERRRVACEPRVGRSQCLALPALRIHDPRHRIADRQEEEAPHERNDDEREHQRAAFAGQRQCQGQLGGGGKETEPEHPAKTVLPGDDDHRHEQHDDEDPGAAHQLLGADAGLDAKPHTGRGADERHAYGKNEGDREVEASEPPLQGRRGQVSEEQREKYEAGPGRPDERKVGAEGGLEADAEQEKEDLEGDEDPEKRQDSGLDRPLSLPRHGSAYRKSGTRILVTPASLCSARWLAFRHLSRDELLHCGEQPRTAYHGYTNVRWRCHGPSLLSLPVAMMPVADAASWAHEPNPLPLITARTT